MPSVEQFDAYVQALGINQGDALVIYDTADNHVWFVQIKVHGKQLYFVCT